MRGGGKSLKTNDLQRFTKFFSLIFIFILLPFAARATITVTHSGSGVGTGTYTTLDAAINACTTTSGTYTITADANHNFSAACTVNANVSIVLQSDVAGTKRTFTRNFNISDVYVTSSLTVYGTLTVTDIIFDGGGLSYGSRRVLGVTTTGTLTMTDCTIQNAKATYNSSHDGGAISMAGNVTLNNCTITQCQGNNGGGGGAVLVNGGILNVNGGSYTYNTVKGQGGAFRVITNATLNINGATISNNTSGGLGYGGSGLGGAIYIGISGVLNISGGETIINDNTAHAAGGGIFSTGGTVNCTGTASLTIRNNKAYSTDVVGSTYVFGGGGICCGSSNQPATINFASSGTVTISQNTTTLNGGGIFIDNGAVTVSTSNCIIQGNQAKYGGGIYLDSGVNTVGGYHQYSGTLNCTGAGTLTVRVNVALTGDGGGICNNGGVLNLSSSSTKTISGNRALNGNGGGIWTNNGGTLTNCTFDIWDNTGNRAQNGGGVYLESGTLAVSGGSYSYSRATSNGGGFYLNGGTLTFSGSPLPAITNNGAQNGGGIYTNIDLTLPAMTFDGNTASQDGAGIYVPSGKTLSVTGATFINNVATRNGGGIYTANGGTLTNCTVGASNNRNTAQNGGGVYLADGTLAVSGGSYSYNTATANGGGFYLNGGTATFSNSPSVNNNGAQNGGGVYTNIDLSLSAMTFDGNTASQDGGGIYVASVGSLTASGTTFINNSAHDGAFGNFNKGGAIYIHGGISTLTNCTVGASDNGNRAVIGGGVYLADGTLSVSGGSYSYNTAVGQDSINSATGLGGGFFINAGTVTFSGSPLPAINNNLAKHGGGIYLNGGSLSLPAMTFDGNTASQDGGGIYVASVGSLTASGTTFINNSAHDGMFGSGDNGGAIYIDGGTSTLTNCIIGTEGNPNSAHDGGGICLESGTLTINEGNCSYNTARSLGGGVYANGGTLIINGGTYSYNTSQVGGGFCFSGTVAVTFGGPPFPTVSNNSANNGGGITTWVSLDLPAMTIDGNSALSSLMGGGGLYVSDDIGITTTDPLITATGTIFTNNTATNYGGAIYLNNGGTFTNCIVGTEGNPNSALSGGGIYLNSGSLTVNGGSYAYNAATNGNGGGFYLDTGNGESTTINFNNPSITYNTATSENIYQGNGGGVCAGSYNMTINVTDGIYAYNTAKYGGGFCLSNKEASFTSTNTNSLVIINNSAAYGGGIYASSKLTVNGGRCSYNTATENGGGIYSRSGGLTVSGTIFTNNTATANGGAIYTTSTNGTLTNCTIGASGEPNSAANGGGIYSETILTINGGSCSYNTATENGGGIYSRSGGLTVSETIFTNNAATNYGGAIWTMGTINNHNYIPYPVTSTKTVQRVEYIEVGTTLIGSDAPTNVSYINTGITFNGGHKTWARLMRTDKEVFGFYAYTGKGNSQRAGYKPLSSNIQHAWPDKGNTTSGNSYTTGTDMTGIFEVEQDYQHIKLTDCNGVVSNFTYSGNASATMSATWTLLRPYVSGSNSKGRLYEAKIWDASGNLIGHYIPCYYTKNGKAIIGVYDAVTQTFLGNANTGSGDFTKGVDVMGETYTAEVQEFEYIETVTAFEHVWLNNCTIGGSTANKNTAAKGGGIYIAAGGVNLKTGSSISYNTASQFGGGVYICENAELGVSGTVTVKDNTTTRSSSTYNLYLKDTKEDDVCLQTLKDDVGTGNIGKIRLKGGIAGSKIGITEEQIASGFHRSLDAEGNKKRQFTLGYGTYYSNKAAGDVFFSNDKILDIFLLTHPHPGTTTGQLEVTLGGELYRSWYIAGIEDDNGLIWGNDANTGLAPDVPLRTLTGPQGVFAKGYNPLNDHIFVVRAVSAQAEADAGRLTDSKVVVRYPNDATAATFLNNTTAIADVAGSEEVILHRYPGGHRLVNGLADNGGGTVVGQVASGYQNGPGANTGPVFAMDNTANQAKLYNIHMDGLREYDGLTDHEVDDQLPNDGSKDTHNPQGLDINPESALLSVESGTTIALLEDCDLLLNDNKDGSDNSATLREKRTGGAVYCAGTLEMDTVTIVKNNCATNGGGVFVTGSGSVTLLNSLVGGNGATDKNTALNGGGFYIDGTGSVTLNEGCRVTYNTATNQGGGVYINANAAMNANGTGTDGVLIKYNHADKVGGGVYKLGSLKVGGLVVITDNTSSGTP